MAIDLLGSRRRASQSAAANTPFQLNHVAKKDIAVIGMGGKFAAADSVHEYWQLLRSGTDGNREFPAGRRRDIQPYLSYLLDMGFSEEGLQYSFGGFLPEIDKFDYGLFQLSPREAALMDPKQRVLLEMMWTAIEDAGYGGDKLRGSRTGVFVGESNDFYDDYRQHLLLQDVDDYGHSVVSNINSITASRIAYLFDLKGPSLMIDTACSSTLVAIHMACQSIRNQECDMALAGGVNVLLTPYRGEKRWEIGIQASDGRAKTFDDTSDGTGTGEGAGVVLLKPLYKALEDRDPIHAIIKGSAINQDGRSAGLTTPNAAAQEEVIVRAWKDAGVEPETISYIEAHGTGTRLGDPIEINGIGRAFSRFTGKKQFCAVGSVKTNIGHLDNCAGIAGFIKCVLALKHKELPPSLHFRTPNRKIPFADSPVYVNDTLQPWVSETSERRCGISSYGLSGTNCHLVLEEAPKREQLELPASRAARLFTVSARTEEGIRSLIDSYLRHWEENGLPSLADCCYTAAAGRGHYSHRLAMTVDSSEALRDRLAELRGSTLATDERRGIYYGVHKVVSGKKNTLASDERTESEKALLDKQCAELLERYTAAPSDQALAPIALVYVEGAHVSWGALYIGEQVRSIHMPVYPFQKARCWMEAAEQGSSERNRMRENDAMLHPVVHRCAAETPEFSVYATSFSIDTHWVLSEHKVLDHYVVPGTTYLEMVREIGSRMLRTQQVQLSGVTFLSPFIVRDGETLEAQAIMKHADGCLPFTIVSRRSEDTEWVTHAEGQVRAIDAATAVREFVSLDSIRGRCSRVEVIDYDHVPAGAIQTGPRWDNVERVYIGEREAMLKLVLPAAYTSDLDSYALHPALMDCAANAANLAFGGGTYLPFMYKDIRVFGPTPGIFYSHVRKLNAHNGGETETFDIDLLDESGRPFVIIREYTIKKVHAEKKLGHAPGDLYQLKWTPTPSRHSNKQTKDAAVLILKDSFGIGDAVAANLRSGGTKVIEASLGHAYAETGIEQYMVPATEEGFLRLLQAVEDSAVSQLIHLWPLSDTDESAGVESLLTGMERGVYSLFQLAKAFTEAKWKQPMSWIVATNGAASVDGTEQNIHPHHAAIAGLSKVLNQEYPNLAVRCVDVYGTDAAAAIVQEAEAGDNEVQTPQVAYRGGVRYTLEVAPLELNRNEEKGVTLHEGGVYLITGGTGGIGLEAARYLARMKRIKLVMINRSELPEREQWASLLAEPAADVRLAAKLQAIREIELSGSNVFAYSADVANEAQMSKLIAGIRTGHGPIRGIIHAAGVAGDGYLMLKDRSTFESVLAPKIVGTWLLDSLTASDDVDFFVMCSSVTAITGGPGQSDYTAANQYMDAFAYQRRLRGRHALSINWPAWKETGMAVDYGVQDAPGVWMPVRTSKAIAQLDELLKHDVPQAIVGEFDYEVTHQLLDQLPFRLGNTIMSSMRRALAHKPFAQQRQQEPDSPQQRTIRLLGKPEQDITETEWQVGAIWASVLGLKELDLYENFNDMGGDSILAAQLYRKMDHQFPKRLHISDIFSYSSVYEMAGYLDPSDRAAASSAQSDAAAEDDEYDALLQKLINGELSPEEASLMLMEG
ncbi:hypothetical protein PCCS19_16520 [Paenibacillus sp. CCS19]|uniref:type I polyketide synthase n=1 Tax=Paenibacillus sp. CCS19 TaxID=3158387 RepID=UPI002564B28A|nr:SDR family NAD(P)-dependent oxidoreductase [Paenibacillus cellulosilyticus]GMK38598.1 hypothetical protein PCCS19_16520 [Paenibacillus cellulosilyticus]